MHREDRFYLKAFSSNGLRSLIGILSIQRSVSRGLYQIAPVKQSVLREIHHHHSFAGLGSKRINLKAIVTGADDGLTTHDTNVRFCRVFL